MCGILAVLGCTDDSQAKRVRVLELSRRQFFFSLFCFLFGLFKIRNGKFDVKHHTIINYICFRLLLQRFDVI